MPTIKSFPNFFSPTPLETLKNIQTVTNYLHQNYHARCYVVGGAVRDRLLDRRCKDYDIECYNITVEDFEEAMAYLGAQGVGKSFLSTNIMILISLCPDMRKRYRMGIVALK